MKHLILVGIILGLVGCTSDDDDKTTPRKNDSSQVRELKEDNSNLSKKLQTCEEVKENLAQQLQNTAAPQSSASSDQQASEEPAQPTTTEVDGFELLKYGDNVVVKVKCQKAESAACGVSFTDCEDGNAYDCLRDVKYKSVKMTVTE